MLNAIASREEGPGSDEQGASMEMTTSTESVSTSAPLSPEHIMQVGLGFWASKTLLSAIEMELFTQLANHPQDLETLRGRVGLHPRSAPDFPAAVVADRE